MLGQEDPLEKEWLSKPVYIYIHILVWVVYILYIYYIQYNIIYIMQYNRYTQWNTTNL